MTPPPFPVSLKPPASGAMRSPSAPGAFGSVAVPRWKFGFANTSTAAGAAVLLMACTIMNSALPAYPNGAK